MAPSRIPERAPIGDAFDGVVLQVESAQALALTAQPGADIALSGSLIVRYGVRYLGKPHISIVPGLVALDYGDLLTGEAAWEFVLKRSHLHPRAEIFGYRNDGTDDMAYIKTLDMALPVEVLVYTDATATAPSARPTALIAPAEAEIPARLLETLPRYDSVAAWQTEIMS
ncbi:MAG: hypothetical protein GYB67_02205 [Chloroflexi bacterium]|nr:hypothetical protein [Chloroflexota bacterium]